MHSSILCVYTIEENRSWSPLLPNHGGSIRRTHARTHKKNDICNNITLYQQAYNPATSNPAAQRKWFHLTDRTRFVGRHTRKHAQTHAHLKNTQTSKSHVVTASCSTQLICKAAEKWLVTPKATGSKYVWTTKFPFPWLIVWSWFLTLRKPNVLLFNYYYYTVELPCGRGLLIHIPALWSI